MDKNNAQQYEQHQEMIEEFKKLGEKVEELKMPQIDLVRRELSVVSKEINQKIKDNHQILDCYNIDSFDNIMFQTY